MRLRLLAILWSLAVLPLPAAEKPNILLIYTDDFGYGDVSAYGTSAVETPHIDRIGKEGIIFTDAHCTAATCTPSRFSLLTGAYPFRQRGTGIASGDAGMIIKPGTTTLPSLLQSVGYHTGVVGKWHLGLGKGKNDWNKEITPNPSHIGFDYHFLMPATGDRVPCVYFEQGKVLNLDPNDPIKVSYKERIDPRPSGKEAPETLKQKWSHGHNQSIINGISRIGWQSGGKAAEWVDEEIADVFTEKAAGFIKDAHGKNPGKPWFLFFSTHDIHVPRIAHPRFAGKSGLGPRGDCILQTDWCVGELLKLLDELELAENTLVMFGSDNGPVLDDGYHDDANEKLGKHDPNGPFRAGKYSLFEGGTRTPFLVRYPARIKAGQRSAALFGQVDLPHSLAVLTGAQLAGDDCPDSLDELDTLLGEDPTGRPHLLHSAKGLSLRQGPWKYIPPGGTRDHMGPWKQHKIPASGALFRVDSDPAERKNLAQEHPEKLKELKAIHEKLRSVNERSFAH